MIVVDASVLVTALGDDGPDGQRVRARIHDQQLAAPSLIDLEVAAALRRLNSVGDIPDRRAQQAIDDLVAIRLRRVPHLHLVARCWELRSNMTIHDAAYVACAEVLDVVLLTADARLANAPGSRCRMELAS